LLKDQEKIERAKSGPDIQCAFCGTRNPATAKVCKQCGADLTQGAQREAGQVVGAFQTGPVPDIACSNCGTLNPATARTCSKCGAPLAKPKPAVQAAPAPTPAASGGIPWLAIVVGVIILGVIVLFGILSFRTNAVVGTVREAHWTRTIPIEGLVPVEQSAWWDEVPADGDIQACQPEVRRIQDSPAPNAREVCGTPYTVDTGTGLGRVVQDCQYEVYEDMCTYTVNEWQVVDVIETSGAGFSPEWPVTSLQPRQRLGAGSERYQCVLAAGDRWYTYEPSTFEAYQQCRLGSEWQLEVNTFGSLMSIQPAN
jgi:ribosomal protein L40E